MLGRNEDALIAKLKAHPQVARLVRTVGALPKMVDDKLLSKYAVDAPALYVAPGTFSVRDDVLVLAFEVACVVKNVASNAAARKGDAKDVGCDQLMTFAVRALHGQRIGDASWALTQGEMVDDSVFDAAGLTVMSLRFESTAIALDTAIDPAELDDFEHFHADFDIPPHESAAERDKWLQEPPNYTQSAPDAQMDVQLPGPTP
ncbi:phage protein Gp37 [Pseudacidovorax intermedius]|uniref:phage protein Gp37 n=1 Tax=Pseudacidovorax intermedius TaxID=433924 RepID=UPI0026ED6B35|nr:phage protein Gp37 [Pseudacidovorax intermedius]